ncbi:AraC family transcriptional regulator with amidase-like domain [Nitrospirillum amazonense]|uniref:AraC family transcriptional regulator with amidase-like domain n=2 Tax=Nitrospirillum amazonense TaxID=28077 RepID=A0A560FSS9_9PROT|nr:AraC family transcriptional regulator with amidase-like domain [Nitrospirillum amazonense]
MGPMTLRRPAQPAPPPPRNRTVAVLAYDGLCTFEFGVAVEVFGLPRPEMVDWYEFRVCAADAGPMRAMGGIQVLADGGLEDLAEAGTIIIPGWRGKDAPAPPALLDALRRAHAGGARLVSICSGVFVLAAAGVLAGKRATTHWRYAQALAERFPDIRVEPDVLYVDEGSVLTSAGSAAGLDLCLHIVRRDHGARIANQVARRLVIPPHRDGGQAQFVEAPLADEAAPLSALFDWIRHNLDQDLPLARLASQARMSERTLVRRFRETAGTSPKDWILTERLNRARTLLEATSRPLEQVAADCGFGSADTLRHHFRTRLRTSPAAYRNRFADAAE